MKPLKKSFIWAKDPNPILWDRDNEYRLAKDMGKTWLDTMSLLSKRIRTALTKEQYPELVGRSNR